MNINKIFIWPFIFLLLISLAYYIAVSYCPAFDSASERISAYQTFLGFIAVLVGYVGIHEIIKKLRQKFDMKLQVVGVNVLDIKSDKYPLTIDLPFYVANTGDLSIRKDDVYYSIRLPKIINLKEVVDAPKNEQGNMIMPKINNNVDYDQNITVISGLIPVNIHPGRRSRIFTLRLEIPTPDKYVLMYYFSTEQGLLPKSITIDDYNEPVQGLGKMGICANKLK